MSASAFLSRVAGHSLGETLFPLTAIASHERNQLIHGGEVRRTMDEATLPLPLNPASATKGSQVETRWLLPSPVGPPMAIAFIPSGPASISSLKILRRDSCPSTARSSAVFGVSTFRILSNYLGSSRSFFGVAFGRTRKFNLATSVRASLHFCRS